jgi:hypothetical protein
MGPTGPGTKNGNGQQQYSRIWNQTRNFTSQQTIKCMRHNYLKHTLTFNWLHTYEKRELFLTAAVKTSNPAWNCLFYRKTNMLNFRYRHIYCKLNFHHYMDSLFVMYEETTYSFSTVDKILMLYFVLIRSKLDNAFFASNSLTITDSNKLGHIQRKSVALFRNRFFSMNILSYWQF